ncbi:MAG: hypothetical protein CM1200mP30_13490 [Pseudomonadota bacterium]|nr:MAG: hypothetical protein CM1200mP30_13490 [Pseudomonadota bacterium]
MASPTSMASRVGESSEYPLRDSLLIYNPRRRKMKLPGRVETWELLVNCLVDRKILQKRLSWIKKPVYGSHGRKIRT